MFERFSEFLFSPFGGFTWKGDHFKAAYVIDALRWRWTLARGKSPALLYALFGSCIFLMEDFESYSFALP